MNVLSLFDGMSCGQIALNRAGIKVDNYFASEIDKYAIQVTMANYPNTIQLGSVIDIDGYKLPKIDILIGGSPCQSFSFAGKRKGMSTKCEIEILTLDQYLTLKSEGYEFEGQSYLFWEYIRILNEVKPKYFLLENVLMSEKWERIISNTIGLNPIQINSSLVSAQNRRRLYWTNIGLEPSGLFDYLESTIKQPKDRGVILKDILENEVDEKYFLSDKRIKYFERGIKKGFLKQICNDINGKSECLLATMYKHMKGFCVASRGRKNGLQTEQEIEIRTNGKSNSLTTVLKDNLVIRSSSISCYTPLECERLQTVPDNYTNHVSDTQRYRMLGNGWTVDVVAHIFSYLK